MGRILQLGSCRVDVEERRAFLEESTHRLTDAEVRLLEYLYANAGRDVSRGELLQEVWGYSPSVRSRAVDQTVKRLRPKIEFDASDPKIVLSVYGVGYRLRRPEGRDRLPVMSGVPGLVPAWVGTTVGRDASIEACTSALEESRWVSVLGGAGVGKSRLANEVARRWREKHAPGGGVWILDCEDVEDDNELLTELGRVLSLTLVGEPSLDRVQSALQTRDQALYVLDNCERMQGVQGVLTELVRRTNAHWLFTSRRRDNVPGDRLMELAPLTDEAAVDLFRQRARAVASKADFPLKDCQFLVQRLECNPLAIELAASHSNLLSPRQIVERFSRDPSMLARSAGGADSRHGTLESAIEHSWQLLDTPDQHALIALSAFQGEFSIRGAEAVLPSGTDPTRIQVLRDNSLVRIRYGGVSPLLSLSPWLRAHARRKQPTLHAEAQGRRDAFLVRLYRDLIYTPNTLPWDGMRPLKPFIGDLESAMRSVTDPTSLAWLALALVSALDIVGDVYGQGRTLRRFRRSMRSDVDDVDARVLMAMAETRLGEVKSDPTHRRAAVEELEATCGPLLDNASLAVRLRYLHLIGGLWLRVDPELARASGMEAVDRAEAVGDPGWEASAHIHCGRMVGMTGNLERAVSHFDSAIDLSSGQAHRLVNAYAHYCTGYASLERLNLEQARQSFEMAREVCDEAGDARAVMLTALLGLIAMGAGDLNGARRHFQESSRYSAEHVASWAIEDAMLMGCVEILDGELEEAIRLLSESVERGRRWGYGPGLAGPLLAACRVQLGTPAAEVAGLLSDLRTGHPLVDVALGRVYPDRPPAPPLAEREGFDAYLARRIESSWRRMNRGES